MKDRASTSLVVNLKAGALSFVALTVENLREASATVAALKGLDLQVGADVVVHVGEAVALQRTQLAEKHLLDAVGGPVEPLSCFKEGLNQVFLLLCLNVRWNALIQRRSTFCRRKLWARPRISFHLHDWVHALPLLRLGTQVSFGAVNSESFFKAILCL